MIQIIFLVFGLAFLLALGLVPWYATRDGRALPDAVADKISTFPPFRTNQHRVDLVLSDGRVIDKVYIAHCRYPSVSPRRLLRPYDVKSVVDVRNSPR